MTSKISLDGLSSISDCLFINANYNRKRELVFSKYSFSDTPIEDLELPLDDLTQRPDGWFALVQAIAHNQFQKAKELVEAEPRLMTYVHVPQWRRGPIETALGIATLHNRIDMIRLFVRAGASPTLVPKSTVLRYPLYMAVVNDRHEAMKALLDVGASSEARVPPAHNKTLFASAIFMNKFEAAAIMLEHGADTMSQDAYGETPLQTALVSRNKEAGSFIERLVQSDSADEACLADQALKSLKVRHLVDSSGDTQQFNANVQAAKDAFAKRLAAIQQRCESLLGESFSRIVCGYLSFSSGRS